MKLYALYVLDDKGEPTVVKHSAHAIGLYSSPMPGDRKQQWIADAWTLAIRKGSLGDAYRQRNYR